VFPHDYDYPAKPVINDRTISALLEGPEPATYAKEIRITFGRKTTKAVAGDIDSKYRFSQKPPFSSSFLQFRTEKHLDINAPQLKRLSEIRSVNAEVLK
jgi:hypothetical protein